MNSDEADRCLRIGQDHFQKGNFEHALKFFNKSQKLDPRDSTAQLIQRCVDEIKNPKPSSGNTGNSDSNTHQSAKFARSKSSDYATPGGSSSTPKSDPIKSQEIRQVLNKKDFYDILGVTKDAKEDEIKKVYRKLALKFHPDKNQEPGADEAFKKIAQAYDCLTNPEKRRKYDEFGNEEPEQHYQHYRQYYNDDISPEDIFGMFFGNAFFQEGPQRRTQFVYRNQRRQGGEHRGQQQGQGNANASKFLPFIQFIPLLIILSFLLFNFQSDEPAYSLSRSSKFHIERKTPYLNVPYYVDNKFTQQYSSKVRAVEESIDRDRTRYLISQCQTNKQRKATLERNAQYYSDERRNRFNEEASKVSLIECDLAKDIQNKYPNLYRAAYYY
jgi:DnaJ family protein B protein 12